MHSVERARCMFYSLCSGHRFYVIAQGGLDPHAFHLKWRNTINNLPFVKQRFYGSNHAGGAQTIDTVFYSAVAVYGLCSMHVGAMFYAIM